MSRAEKARKIRAHLTKLASSNKSLTINELRIVLALERIVARLECYNKLQNRLVYKGGFVLMKITGSERFTRDLDASGVNITKDDIIKLVPAALAVDIADGFWFGDIRVKLLDEQDKDAALRFDCAYQIGEPELDKISKYSRIHFDVSFKDTPSLSLRASKLESLLLDEIPIAWQVYPLEFIFSEKLQTLVQRASANSRAKDIYDLCLLFDQCTDRGALHEAVKVTFNARQTEVPRSFYDFARSFNLLQIRASWNSVRLSTGIDFETVWNSLLARLKQFDSQFS